MKATLKSAKGTSFQPLEIKTTWGMIVLTLNGNRVVALDLPHLNKNPNDEFSVMNSEFNSVDFFRQIEREFAPVKMPAGTGFQQAVWKELKKIPRGQTRTYGEIAAAIGCPNAARAVGSACGANPLPVFIPCHRVVAKNGLGGFGSGLPWKKLLLKEEGWMKGLVD
jgi:O-6-methylguanine DNA methyltransferase